jgi:anti-sigma regulatory factor (Ser/Thr protein kinase)
MALMEERIMVILEGDVLKAQRVARETAHDLGFGTADAEEAAIIATELARNHLKHRAVHGEIIFRQIREGAREGLEITAQDTGPGIRDVEAAMERSTVGTLGIGLSGVRRLSDRFHITSSVDTGTIVTAVKWLKGEIREGMNFSVLSRPKPGEDVNGDSWFIKHLSHAVIFGVIDALGHGREAYLTSLRAQEAIEENYREPLDVLIRRTDQMLKNTRGVAMSVCHIDYPERIMRHVGIGNVETHIYCTERSIRPYCFNGTLGMRMEKFRVLEYPYEEGETIVMFSDGISGRFELGKENLCIPPQELASWILGNYSREYDDATVLVGR